MKFLNSHSCQGQNVSVNVLETCLKTIVDWLWVVGDERLRFSLEMSLPFCCQFLNFHLLVTTSYLYKSHLDSENCLFLVVRVLCKKSWLNDVFIFLIDSAIKRFLSGGVIIQSSRRDPAVFLSKDVTLNLQKLQDLGVIWFWKRDWNCCFLNSAGSLGHGWKERGKSCLAWWQCVRVPDYWVSNFHIWIHMNDFYINNLYFRNSLTNLLMRKETRFA